MFFIGGAISKVFLVAGSSSVFFNSFNFFSAYPIVVDLFKMNIDIGQELVVDLNGCLRLLLLNIREDEEISIVVILLWHM